MSGCGNCNSSGETQEYCSEFNFVYITCIKGDDMPTVIGCEDINQTCGDGSVIFACKSTNMDRH